MTEKEAQRLRDIEAKAREVREAQRRYFRTRDTGALRLSQKLERELDALLSPQQGLGL